MTVIIHKPTIVIEELGELGLLPDGAIINAGGVIGPNFTVGGKALIFADGTATDGSGPVINPGGGSGGSGGGGAGEAGCGGWDSDAACGTVVGFRYMQPIPSDTWTIMHDKGSISVQVSIWNEANELVMADVVKILDSNTVRITFASPQTGYAILMLF